MQRLRQSAFVANGFFVDNQQNDEIQTNKLAVIQSFCLLAAGATFQNRKAFATNANCTQT